MGNCTRRSAVEENKTLYIDADSGLHPHSGAWEKHNEKNEQGHISFLETKEIGDNSPEKRNALTFLTK